MNLHVAIYVVPLPWLFLTNQFYKTREKVETKSTSYCCFLFDLVCHFYNNFNNTFDDDNINKHTANQTKMNEFFLILKPCFVSLII